MKRQHRTKQKLTRSANDRYVAGVLGGLARYFHLNAKWLRIGYVIFTILTSFMPGILLYVLLAITMPADPQAFNLRDWLNNLQHPTDNEPQRSGRRVLHDVEEHDIKSGRKR